MQLIYMYTLNLLDIMFLYYFVPFFFSNNSNPLFYVSSGHISVTVQNRTHVHMNSFDHRS